MAERKKSARPARRPARKVARKVARTTAPRSNAKKVQPVPRGYRTVTPYLVVKGVAKLLDFLQAALGAKVKHRAAMPDGTVAHAEIKIGDSMVMLGEARGESRPMTSMIYLYVKDTDKLYKQAMKAGATSVMAPADQFYGDRNAGVKDPCGNQWWIGTHVENVSSREMKRRMQEACKEK